jgi:hypothetical protein
MGFATFVALAFVAVVVVSILAAVAENKKVVAMSPSEKKTYLRVAATLPQTGAA